MKLHLIHLEPALAQGIRELQELLSLALDAAGLPVQLLAGDALEISRSKEAGRIVYPSTPALFRGLALFVHHSKARDSFHITEEIQIPECGAMLDLSRNGVMTLDSLRQYIRQMAVMGLNQLYLYMEDCYTLEGRPYFGYGRGPYTPEELRQIDDYAHLLGVEAIPHIQVLGHMEQYIKWDEGLAYRDTEKILIAGEEGSYQLIEEAIAAVSSCFRTKKIHLGCDEAGNLGSGKYYGKNGYVDRKKILLDHINRVIQISDRYGLTPIVYGDVFFAALQNSQYATTEKTEISQEFLDSIPRNLRMVYWKYDAVEQGHYELMLENYQQITPNVIFWGGIWTWFGFCPDNRLTLQASSAALAACKARGIQTAIASVWVDNGCECNHHLGALGLQIYAEHMYNAQVSEAQLREHFALFTGGDYDAFLEMSDFHNDFENHPPFDQYFDRYYGKRFLWADVMLGLMDKDLMEHPRDAHYRGLCAKFRAYGQRPSPWAQTYQYVADLCDLLARKCFIAQNLKAAYDAGNRDFLRECAQVLLPELKCCYQHMRNLHKAQWLAHFKPFGFEVLDIRYGGASNRMDYAMERLSDYLEGTLSQIPELEAERLLHRCEWTQKFYSSVATACYTI